MYDFPSSSFLLVGGLNIIMLAIMMVGSGLF